MPDDRLHKEIFRSDWAHCTDNWCMYIKEILEEFELEYCFNEMPPVDIDNEMLPVDLYRLI